MKVFLCFITIVGTLHFIDAASFKAIAKENAREKRSSNNRARQWMMPHPMGFMMGGDDDGEFGDDMEGIPRDYCALRPCSASADCTNNPMHRVFPRFYPPVTCTCKDGLTGNGFTCQENGATDSQTGSDVGTNQPAGNHLFGGLGMFRPNNFMGFFMPGGDDDGPEYEGDEDDGGFGRFIDYCLMKPCSPKADCKSNMMMSMFNRPMMFAPPYTCTCKKGYSGNGIECKDIDECSPSSPTHDCPPTTKCENEEGKFKCVCDIGYIGFGKSCQDLDECLIGAHDCDVNADCSNTIGSYSCKCKDGYNGDGYLCTDVDECATGDHNCDVGATCANTIGGFTCTCNPGLVGDGVNCS